MNKNLFADLDRYIRNFNSILVDTSTLSSSYRCSPKICDYVTNHIGVEIQASNEKEGDVFLLDDENDIKCVVEDNNIVKLFYQNSKKYKCYSMNWGDSKGINKFTDVCVVLNKTTKIAYNKGKLHELPSMTKNKLYVACTRAKRNLYLVDEAKLKSYK